MDSVKQAQKLMNQFVTAVLVDKPKDVIAYGQSYFSSTSRPTEHTDNLPLVICGPSGVGKGTIVSRLLEHDPDHFALSVSHTTRAPRPGEIPGVHYHFVSREAIRRAVNRGEFLEHAEVHGNLYGTSKQSVRLIRETGRVCVLTVDVQGVRQLKASNFQARYLFVTASSMEVLEQRLRARHTETEESVNRRLQDAKSEIQYGLSEGNFDMVLENGDLEVALETFFKQIHVWYPQLSS